jgi:hypothetical protein
MTHRGAGGWHPSGMPECCRSCRRCPVLACCLYRPHSIGQPVETNMNDRGGGKWGRVGDDIEIAGEPHTPRDSAIVVAVVPVPLRGGYRRSAGMTSRPTDPSFIPAPVISAPPAASRQPSESAPSLASGPSPPSAAHVSSEPSGCAPTPRRCVGHAGAAMHPALPAGHRWCPARLARSGSGATSRGGLSQRQGYSPIGHAPLGVCRQLRSHPCPFPAFAGWTLPTIA